MTSKQKSSLPFWVPFVQNKRTYSNFTDVSTYFPKFPHILPEF